MEATTPTRDPQNLTARPRRMQGAMPRALHIVPIVAALCLSTTACGDFWNQPSKNGPQPLDPDYAAFCADPTTEHRLPDDECDPAPETFTGSDYDAVHYHPAGNGDHVVALWYYVDATSDHVAPPIGGHVSGGSYRTPRTRVYDPRKPAVIVRRGSTPPQGGKVDKGSVNRSVSTDPKAGPKAQNQIQRGGFGVPDANGRSGSASAGKGTSAAS